jgi:hypothetical protein
MTTRSTLWVFAIALAACSGPTQPAQVGDHRLLLSVPAGWEFVALGREGHVRMRESSVVLEDRGPMTGYSDFARFAAAELRRLGQDPRRDVKQSRMGDVDQRPALFVDTWMRHDHTNPGHAVYMLDGDRILAVRTGSGLPETSAAAFEAVVKSLRFATSAR